MMHPRLFASRGPTDLMKAVIRGALLPNVRLGHESPLAFGFR